MIDPNWNIPWSRRPPTGTHQCVLQQTTGGHNVPRAILNPGSLDHRARTGPVGQWFRPDKWCGQQVDQRSLQDVVRKAKGSTCLQGFLLYYSLRGASCWLRHWNSFNLEGSRMETFSVIPSTKVSDAVVELYNAVFISISSKRIRTNTCCWRTGPCTTSVSAY